MSKRGVFAVTGSARNPASRQRGMTLVELLVALLLGLLVALAATVALTVARRGFTTVDAGSQLRDSSRFAVDILSRLVAQTGFEDLTYALSTRKREDGTATNPSPGIYGFNNALASPTDPLGTAVKTGQINGSDVLVVRYQASETFTGSGRTDGTMIDCQGNSVPTTAVPSNRDDRMASVFHVAMSNGEPSLMCTTVSSSNATATIAAPIPVVQGVEDFQVLYGVDGVVANVAPAATLAKPVKIDRYLNADQLTVTGDPVGTNANWRRVTSVRIGMVLRAAANSGQDPSLQTYYPFFGRAASTDGAGATWLYSVNDPGTKLVIPANSDTRLRQVTTFTVYLRNPQDLSNPQ